MAASGARDLGVKVLHVGMLLSYCALVYAFLQASIRIPILLPPSAASPTCPGDHSGERDRYFDLG